MIFKVFKLPKITRIPNTLGYIIQINDSYRLPRTLKDESIFFDHFFVTDSYKLTFGCSNSSLYHLSRFFDDFEEAIEIAPEALSTAKYEILRHIGQSYLENDLKWIDICISLVNYSVLRKWSYMRVKKEKYGIEKTIRPLPKLRIA